MKSLVEAVNPIQHVNILRHILVDDGTFPNNAHLALVVYRNALKLTAQAEVLIEQLFESNGWSNAWRDGVCDYHHYHSTTHEVLGVIKGSSRIQFGGPQGISLMLEAGDVVMIPAGVAHKNLGGESDFTCIGAYPDGRDYDLNYGKSGERPTTDANIKKVPLPETDPVFGISGPLVKEWMAQPTEIKDVL